MMNPQRGFAGGLLAVGVAVTLAGCGSSSSTGANPTPVVSSPSQGAPNGSASPQRSSTSPKPVATESNPPGDIPDDAVFITYAPHSHAYSIKVPEGWARTTTSTGASFTDKLNTIATDLYDAARAPTVASARATNVPQLRSSVPQFSLQDVATFTRAGGSGVLITYQADSAPDPVTNKVVRDAVEQYLFWNNGQEVALTLTGPVNADNVDPWMIVSDSFRWTK